MSASAFMTLPMVLVASAPDWIAAPACPFAVRASCFDVNRLESVPLTNRTSRMMRPKPTRPTMIFVLIQTSSQVQLRYSPPQ